MGPLDPHAPPEQRAGIGFEDGSHVLEAVVEVVPVKVRIRCPCIEDDPGTALVSSDLLGVGEQLSTDAHAGMAAGNDHAMQDKGAAQFLSGPEVRIGDAVNCDRAYWPPSVFSDPSFTSGNGVPDTLPEGVPTEGGPLVSTPVT